MFTILPVAFYFFSALAQDSPESCSIFTVTSYGSPIWNPDGQTTVGAVQSPGWGDWENPISTFSDHDVDPQATASSGWGDWKSNQINAEGVDPDNEWGNWDPSNTINAKYSGGWDDWIQASLSSKPMFTQTSGIMTSGPFQTATTSSVNSTTTPNSITSTAATTMTTTTPPPTITADASFVIIANGPGSELKRRGAPFYKRSNTTSYVSFNGSYADVVNDFNRATVFSFDHGRLIGGGMTVGLPFNLTDKMQKLSTNTSNPWNLATNGSLTYNQATGICTDPLGFIYILITPTALLCRPIFFTIQDYTGPTNATNTTITIGSTVTVIETITAMTTSTVATTTI